MYSALTELRDVILESDISPFEMNHSGLIKALLNYLTTTDAPGSRYDRLKLFWKLFAESTVNIILYIKKLSYFFIICSLIQQMFVLQLQKENMTDFHPGAFGALVSKLSSCVSQLEQFPVKVHDLPAGSGAGRGGTSALKFFNTHQLKVLINFFSHSFHIFLVLLFNSNLNICYYFVFQCNLQRHPDCNNLKQWKGGTVKVDPLALVQTIERYLMVRGYGRIRDAESMVSDDDNSEDDIDDTLVSTFHNVALNK